MRIVPYKASHLEGFKLQGALEGTSPFITKEYAAYLEGKFSYTLLADDGTAVAAGGIAELWPGRGLAWTLISEGSGKKFVEIHKAAKRMLALAKDTFRRIEADTPCEFEQGHRWLKMLGFELETAEMKAYRPDGGSSSMYVMVKED